MVDLQQEIKLRPITEEETEAEEAEHGHGRHEEGEKAERGHGPAAAEKHEHHHEAGEMDPHTWLDPRLAKIQARTLADTLIQMDPVRKEQYEKNLKEFHTDLDAVHDQLTTALAPLKGKSFFVFHPAYAYFGEAYGLKQVPVQLEGREPLRDNLRD